MQNACKTISEYLRQQNRPYSVLQIFDNFHKRIGKGLVEQALEDRNLEKMNVRVKVFGKAKLYFYDQSKLQANFFQADLNNLDRDIAQLVNQIRSAEAEHKNAQSALRALTSEPTDADIDGQLAELEARVAEKAARAATISSAPIDPNALRDVVAQHNFFRKEWVARKRTVIDIVKDISDGSGKKTKDVVEMIGIETDEDNGCTSIPPIIPDVV